MKSYFLSTLTLLIITASFCKAQGPTLWGMTFGAGSGTAFFDTGAIISYNIASSTETVQHYLCCGTEGILPMGTPLRASNGLLYGMTLQGGPYTVYYGGAGLIFSYDISSGSYVVLHDFGTSDTAGAFPSGSLIQANNSLLYGMTNNGGMDTFGTIFSYNISNGNYAVLHDFGGNSGSPSGSLIQANNGLLYGMTHDGSSNDSGTIFSYNITTGVETTLHTFTGPDGSYPGASLVQASDGLLYGMTFGGGRGGNGVIFSYNITTDTFTDLHFFGAGTDGANPGGSLIQASDSLLYGMTQNGGVYGGGLYSDSGGIIFSYKISTGTYTDVHDFGNGNDGAQPAASLFQASNGLLYGMTSYGGDSIWAGTIFSYNISTGMELVLHSFGTDSDAWDPEPSNLIEIGDTTAGINPIALNNQLQIFPNPTTGQFTIQLPDNQSNYPTEIYSVLGQKIVQTVLSPVQNTLNLSNQAAGMYFINVQTDDGVETGKVMIMK